jgi:cytochrome c-type biogenesis protein CcmH/NrfF
MRFVRVICITAAAVAILLPGTLAAQSAHSRLTDPTLLKRFDALSHKLMCTCGCNMPLRNCNHTGHCNAWPARDALDKLLIAGVSDDKIIDGFRNGFGPDAEKSEAFAMAKQNDYAYMMVQFKNGFGAQIMSIPESNYLGTFAILGGILCAGFMALFVRSRRKRPKSEEKLALLDDKRREELLRKLSADHR